MIIRITNVIHIMRTIIGATEHLLPWGTIEYAVLVRIGLQ